MTRLPMSRAAAALFRSLLLRTGGERDRILLSQVDSTDWHSLIFTGERHQFLLHLTGPDAEGAFRALTDGLEDAEFAIPGQIVADIRADRRPESAEGSIAVAVEALTIAE